MFRDQYGGKEIIAAMGVPQQLQYGAAGEKCARGIASLQTIEIEPLARLVEAELSEKLEADIRFTFDRLAAIDINARAQGIPGVYKWRPHIGGRAIAGRAGIAARRGCAGYAGSKLESTPPASKSWRTLRIVRVRRHALWRAASRSLA